MYTNKTSKMSELKPEPLIAGGSEFTTFGSSETYGKSVYSKAKKSLILGIAKAMKDKLKIPGIVTDEKNLDAVVESLRKFVPDPRAGGNGKRWADNAGKQEHACRVIGEVLNEHLGKDVINTKAGPADLCEQVVDVLESVFSGIHSEYLSIRANAERVLKNLETLSALLEAGYTKATSMIPAETRAQRAADLGALEFAHKEVKSEADRQLAILRNFLNIESSKTDKNLEAYLKESKDLRHLVKRIKVAPGTAKFGEKVAYVLTDAGRLAGIAREVREALKLLGVSHAEYAKESGKELEAKLHEAFRKLGADAPSKQVGRYMDAVKAILKHEGEHDRVAEELKKGASEDECSSVVEGGAPEPPKTPFAKHMDHRKKAKSGMMTMFTRQLSSVVDNILTTTSAIAKAISAGRISLDDDLVSWYKAAELIPKFSDRSVYFAISGYNHDAESREKRENFVSAVRHFIERTKALSSPLFKDLVGLWSKIIDIVTDYSERFAKDADKFDYRLPGGLKGEKSGADEEGVEGSAEPHFPELSRVAFRLEDIQVSIKFFMRTALMARNFSRIATEARDAGKGYERILGEAIGKARHEVQDKCGKLKTASGKILSGTLDNDAKAEVNKMWIGLSTSYDEILKNHQYDSDHPDTSDSKKAVEEAKKAIVKYRDLVLRIMNSKDNLLQTAEAVDIYLREFTNGLLSHPEDIKDIHSMLSSTEVISKWYSKKAGDMLCRVFETFPSHFTDGAHPLAAFSNLDGEDYANELHYYWKVKSITQGVATGAPAKLRKIISPSDGTEKDATAAMNKDTNALPGVPYLGLQAVRQVKSYALDKVNKDHSIKKVLKHMGEFTTHFVALKNIIATFVNIGDKFGGKVIHNLTNFTPAQIYKSLCEYMTYGSIQLGVIGKKEGLPAATAPVVVPGVAPAVVPVAAPVTFHGGVTHGGLKTMAFAGTSYAVADQVVLGVNQAVAAVATDPYQLTMHGFMRSAVSGGIGKGSHGEIPFGDFMKTGDLGADTDWIFQMIIKSIVAKIFTVMGTYNMMYHPVDKNSIGYYSDIRMTLGGADEYPQVIPEALEKYIRIPLLLEFYRDVLDISKDPGDLATGRGIKQNGIAAIPEMTGEFSGIFDLSFVKTKDIKQGMYSEAHTRCFIEEINKLHKKYPKTSDCVQALVDEINRRIGILTASDRKMYKKHVDKISTSRKFDEEQSVDYEILPGGEDDLATSSRRPGASSNYVGTAGSGTAQKIWKHSIDDKQYEYLSILRENVAAALNKFQKNTDPETGTAELNHISQNSFEDIIRGRTEELKSAKSERDRFNVVASSINGFGGFATNILEHSLLLFNETVILGCNTLHALFINLYYTNLRLQELGKFAEAVSVSDGDVDYAARIQKHKICTETMKDDEVAMDSDKFDNRYCANAAPGSGDAYRFTKCNAQSGRTLRDFVTALYEHADGNLINMQIESQLHPKQFSGKQANTLVISLDHTKIVQRVESVLIYIKAIIDKLRGLIPSNVIDNYAELGSASSPNVGSVHWLEEHFLRGLLQGKTKNFATSHIGLLNDRVKSVADLLTRYWGDAGVERRFEAAHVFPVVLNLVTIKSTIGAGDLKEDKSNISATTKKQSTFYEMLNVPKDAAAGESYFGNVDQKYYKIFNADDILDNSGDKYGSGLVLEFNKLIYSYLTTGYDSGSRKIYEGLLRHVMSGPLASGIQQLNKTIDDSNTASVPQSPSELYKAQSPLLKSSAVAIFNLYNATVKSKKEKFFLISDIQELPEYTKEKLRAELPFFIKMFDLVAAKAALLLKFCSNDLFEISDAVNAAVPGAGTIHETLRQFAFGVQEGSKSFIKCAKEVCTEIENNSVCMEVRANFIKDYESIHGVRPFMPVSSLAAPLSESNEVRVRPNQATGSPAFKFLYASKCCESKCDFSSIPGFRDIVKTHNMTSEGIYHVKEKESEEFLGNALPLVWYCFDRMQCKRFLADPAASTLSRLRYDAAAGAIPGGYTAVIPDEFGLKEKSTTKKSAGCVYQLRKDAKLSEIMMLTESGDYKASRKTVARYVGSEKSIAGANDRESVVALNIVDMNIMPLNQNILMREIPLANLYNYSYTYDRMICDITGIGREISDKRKNAFNIADLQGKFPDHEILRKVFGWMLINPYGEMDFDEYLKYVGDIMRGQVSIDGLGHPKFLGEEVWNKSLFGELVESPLLSDKSQGKGDGKYFTLFLRQMISGCNLPTGGGALTGFGQVLGPEQVKTDKLDSVVQGIIRVMFTHIKGGPLDEKVFVVEVGKVIDSGKVVGVPDLGSGVNMDAASPFHKAFMRLLMLTVIVTKTFNIVYPRSDIETTENSSSLVACLHALNPSCLSNLLDRANANANVLTAGDAGVMDYLSAANPNAVQNRDGVLLRANALSYGYRHYSERIGTSIYLSSPNISFSDKLSFPNAGKNKKGNSGKNDLEIVPLTKDIVSTLKSIGKLRFDTVFMRNIIWITNIQRVLRLKIRRDATWYEGKLVKGTAIMSKGITEQYGNDVPQEPGQDYNY